MFADAAELGDAPDLAAIESACVGSGWSVRAFERLIQDPTSRVVLLRAPLHAPDSGDIAGYCAFRVVADEMEILSLALRSEWRRQGLGRWLTGLAFTMGARRGARTAFLEVRSGNEPARGLYAALGLRETGRRTRYYKDPVEDAVVLGRML